MEHSIVQWGCRCASMSIVSGAFMCAASHVERHAKLLDSVLGLVEHPRNAALFSMTHVFQLLDHVARLGPAEQRLLVALELCASCVGRFCYTCVLGGSCQRRRRWRRQLQ